MMAVNCQGLVPLPFRIPTLVMASTNDPISASMTPHTNPSLAAIKAEVDELLQWSSALRTCSVKVDHVAVDITTDRLLFHLDCELERPLPANYADHTENLCLGYPLGGMWKIREVKEDRRFVTCVAWKKTELKRDQVAEIAAQLVPSFDGSQTTSQVEVFSWMMQLGAWEKHNHWFARATDKPEANAQPPALTATLMAGFAPLEAVLNVNRITAVDTVAQTFAADVTWEVTLRGITTIREDSVLRELLDLLDFDETQFEFTNLSEVASEQDLASKFLPAGRVQFLDSAKSDVDKGLHHLQYYKRLSGVFSEEMSLYYFPFDQQKLTFTFEMTNGLQPSMAISPAPAAPGTFAVQSFKLGNMFNVVYGDKVFVGKVVDTESRKVIRFELMLERQSSYCLANVALPAMIITFLCFTSYAPLADGTLLDTSSRLQIVTTLLLTIVTFKMNLSSLIPQVSYFTSIDKYVFFCFMVTCIVTIENSLYPLVVEHLPNASSWNEGGLLGFSVGTFTLINAVWGLTMFVWVRLRARRTQTLLLVNEYVSVLAGAVPREHREAVLTTYLAQQNFKPWMLPTILASKRGDVFIQLPNDSPKETAQALAVESAKVTNSLLHKKALRNLPDMQRIYQSMDTVVKASTETSRASVVVQVGTKEGASAAKNTYNLNYTP